MSQIDLADYRSSGLEVFPNPAPSVVYLKLNNTAKPSQNYEIRNVYGQLVKEGLISNGEAETDISDMAAGLYLICTEGQCIKMMVE